MLGHRPDEEHAGSSCCTRQQTAPAHSTHRLRAGCFDSHVCHSVAVDCERYRVLINPGPALEFGMAFNTAPESPCCVRLAPEQAFLEGRPVILPQCCKHKNALVMSTELYVVSAPAVILNMTKKWSIQIRRGRGLLTPCSKVATNHQSRFALVRYDLTRLIYLCCSEGL